MDEKYPMKSIPLLTHEASRLAKDGRERPILFNGEMAAVKNDMLFDSTGINSMPFECSKIMIDEDKIS